MSLSVDLVLKPSARAWNQISQAFFRTEKTRILLHGSVASLALRASGMVLRLLVGVMLARLLGASGYGIYAYAVTWLAVLTMPTTLGLDQVLLRYIAAYRETQSWPSLKGLLRFTILLGLFAATIVSLISIMIVAMLPRIEWNLRTTMWMTLALLPIVVLAQLRQNSLRGFDHPVIAQLPENIVYPGFLLLFIGVVSIVTDMSLTVIHVALANAVSWIVAFAVGTLLLVRKVPSQVRVSVGIYERATWLRMTPPLIFVAMAYHVMSRADVLILGALGTTRDVGIYLVANRGAELMLFMYDAVTLSGASLFSSIYATGNMKELQQFTNLVTKSIFWISLPIYFLFILATPWFLGLFGEEFVQGAGLMRFLLTTFFLSSLAGFVNIMLYMAGHQRDVAVVTGIAASINIALSFGLIPWLGMLGAAIASGTSVVLMKWALVFLLQKRTGIISFPFRFSNRSLKKTYDE